ncbi:MAG TPA: cytochrome c [Candidatus Acidoferrum sp.]|jgi:mono/diheme cytochrome c family protein|nr:cytochrome c [Candidatus Acidoferrum sp.]
MRSASFGRIVALAMFLSCAAAVAQDKNDRESSNELYAELAKAPAKAAARGNPLESDPKAVAAGAKLFARHCAECHGDDGAGGTGNKKGPSLLVAEVQQSTPGTLFWLLTNGVVRRGMPVWSKLPEPQRWQLVSYIKSLDPGARIRATEAPNP